MAEYKYFLHHDAQGNVIGWDMGPPSMVHPKERNTTEITKEEFEKEVDLHEQRKKFEELK